MSRLRPDALGNRSFTLFKAYIGRDTKMTAETAYR